MTISLKLEGGWQYDRCGDKFLKDGNVNFIFTDDCNEDYIAIELDGELNTKDGKIFIKKRDLLAVLNVFGGK